jgi:hypothetical protein
LATAGARRGSPSAGVSTTGSLADTGWLHLAATGNRSDVCAGPNVTIDNGFLVAQWTYIALVIGGANAWHYDWWLKDGGTTAGNARGTVAVLPLRCSFAAR